MLMMFAPAAEADTKFPQVVAPLPYQGKILQVQIDGPPNLWGLRKVAHRVDAKLEEVKFFYRGDCASHKVDQCLIVKPKNYGNTGFHGVTVWGPLPRVIRLNNFYGEAQFVACHELMHGLGLDHHRQVGCVATDTTRALPSKTELKRLRHFY